MRSNSIQLLGFIAATALVLACARQEATEPPVGSATQLPVERVDTLVRELNTGVTERKRDVIRSQEEWGAFWARVYAPLRPVPELPAVNFEESVIVVASMGERSSGGYAIDVDEVEQTDAGLRVVVRETSPGASCMTTAALTQPVVAVRVPRTEGDIVFEERRSVLDCS